MQILSSAFVNNQEIPQKYSCQGQGINPPIIFNDIPANTKSLALIVDDPDAPGGTFTHWVIWNINPSIKEIAENQVPIDAIEGKNSMGTIGFVAPCPPSGVHHYYFTVYALNTVLSLPKGTIKQELVHQMENYVIEKAELVGTYSKK